MYSLNDEEIRLIMGMCGREITHILNDTKGYPHYKPPLTVIEREHLDKVEVLYEKLAEETSKEMKHE